MREEDSIVGLWFRRREAAAPHPALALEMKIAPGIGASPRAVEDIVIISSRRWTGNFRAAAVQDQVTLVYNRRCGLETSQWTG
jgi:hypothetical protein